MSDRSMDIHARCLELVGIALDFPLDTEEQAFVRQHLATCPDCAATANAMRSDAVALAGAERLPAPGRVRMAVVQAASDPRTSRGASAGWRWSAIAAALVLVLVGGVLLAGMLRDRSERTPPVASQPVTALVSPEPSTPATSRPDRTPARTPMPTDRPTQEPTPRPTSRPTERPTPRPTPRASTEPTRAPGPSSGWTDLGILDGLGGSTVSMILPAPDGGLVAIGREASSALPSVWVSDDGVHWTAVEQPKDAFGGRVPGSGVLHDGRLWVVGWDLSVEAGGQRAIWSSSDGRTWSRVRDASGLLGTQLADVRIDAGERGLIAWTTAGRAWTSRDGATWVRSSVGIGTLTDVAVTGDAWLAVGRDGERAAVSRSTDGRTWSAPGRRTATADDQPGIETDTDGVLLAWVGTQTFDVSSGSWRARSGAAPPAVGGPADVVGGNGFAAFLGPTSAGVQRVALGDGSDAWRTLRSEAADAGARTMVGAVALDDGWFVLSRQGTTYRGWKLAP